MRLKKFFIDNLVVTVGLLVAATLVVYAQSSWSGPTAAPPGNNTPAPLNVSAADQLKDGGLGVGRLAVFGNAYVSGNVGVGVTAPTQALDVGGYIRGGTGLCIGSDCRTSWPAGGAGGIPSGAIMPFFLPSCPSGWLLADGTNGTPDLRGAFIRGIFGGQNGRDPDGNRALGSFQSEDFKSHTHRYRVPNAQNNIQSEANSFVWRNSIKGVLDTSATGGPETRPDNVALLYCQKA